MQTVNDLPSMCASAAHQHVLRTSFVPEHEALTFTGHCLLVAIHPARGHLSSVLSTSQTERTLCWFSRTASRGSPRARSNLTDIHTSNPFFLETTGRPGHHAKKFINNLMRCGQPSTCHPRHLVGHPVCPSQRHFQTTTLSCSHVTPGPALPWPLCPLFHTPAALGPRVLAVSRREHPL